MHALFRRASELLLLLFLCSLRLGRCSLYDFLSCFNSLGLRYACLEPLVEKRRKCSTCKRSYDEYPYILECVAACKKCRSDASCRVYRSACKTNAEDMYECECQTDYKSAE